MKTKRFWLGLVITLAMVVFVLAGNAVLADPPPAPVKVLVNFYQAPGAGEIQKSLLVSKLGT